MTNSQRRTSKNSRRSDTVFGYLIPFVIIGLAVADFLRDGEIDKYLIGSLMILGLASLGYRVDVLIESYIKTRALLQQGADGNAAEPDNGS